ncbi:hypothetical protein L6452_31741 [Arctium lappa]|uniref:Uncharacterized protein n=1 Tax=Arctium lappa TaxID=4217 RepID=A0ACB8Z3K4_ARCLA|nr:hypothetical protein L6452_31741 [Arctium lappa]
MQYLSESIACQLSLLPTIEEWEVEDDSNGITISGGVEISETLTEKLRKKLEGKKILLVLDDVMDDETKRNVNEEKFWLAWREMFPFHDNDEKLKIVFISRSSREDEGLFKVEVEAMPRAESNALLIEKLDAQMRQSLVIRTLGENFIKKSNGLPVMVCPVQLQ